MTAGSSLTETIQFVVAEFDRLQELQKQDWKSLAHEMELSMGMPSDRAEFPNKPRHHYPCGKKAEQRLYEEVAVRVRNDGALTRRISTQTVFRELQVEIAQNCIEQRKSVTPQLATTLFVCAKEHALKKAVDRIYYFPVFAVQTADKGEFSVGAASFLRTKVFFERHKDVWERSIENELAEIDDRHDKPLVKKNIERLHEMAEKYYRQFPCIASVRIDGAEPDLGRVAATAVLEASFNILRLFVSSSRRQFIGLGEESLVGTGKSWIEQHANGDFIAWHRGPTGEPYAPKDSVRQMRLRMPPLAFIEEIIEKQRTWKALSPLESRLITGLRWYGDGWKEPVQVARLVKFAVALETLIMTGGKEAISETLAERIALLCGADTPQREELYAETRSVYTARSKAVHGATRHDVIDLAEVNEIAAKLCVWALSSCAGLYPTLIGRKDETKALTEFFKIAKLGGIEEAAARIGAVIVPTPGASQD